MSEPADAIFVLSYEAWGAMNPPAAAIDEVVALIRPLDQWAISAMAQWGVFGEWDGSVPPTVWAADRYRRMIDGILRWVEAIGPDRCRIRLLRHDKDGLADALGLPPGVAGLTRASNPRPATDFLVWLRRNPRYRSAHEPWADFLWSTWVSPHSELSSRLGLSESDASYLRAEGAGVLTRLSDVLSEEDAASALDAASAWSSSAPLLRSGEVPLAEITSAPDEQALHNELSRGLERCEQASRAIISRAGKELYAADSHDSAGTFSSPPRQRRLQRRQRPVTRPVNQLLEALHHADQVFRANARVAMVAGAMTPAEAAELAGLAT